MASSYLDSILTGQAQRRVAGGGALTPSQIESVAYADIAAQYQSGATRRSLNIAQQRADTEAAALAASEEQYASTLGQRQTEFAATSTLNKEQLALQKSIAEATVAYQNKTLEGQKSAEKTQALVTGGMIAALSSDKLIAGGKAAYNALFGTKPVTPVTTPVGGAETIYGTAGPVTTEVATTGIGAGSAEVATTGLEAGYTAAQEGFTSVPFDFAGMDSGYSSAIETTGAELGKGAAGSEAGKGAGEAAMIFGGAA